MFALLELAVRLFVDESLYKFSNVSDEWVADDEIGYKNIANYYNKRRHKDKMITVATNSDGLQPATLERTKKQGVKRVMLIGNSTVYSRDVPENEKIHHYLDSMLEVTGQSYEIVNAGVTGYSTDQSLLTLKRYIDIYEPDYVGYNYCINDLYANTKDTYWKISKPLFEIKNGELNLIPADPTLTELEGDQTSLSSLIQFSALYGLLRPYIQRVRMKYSEQAVLDQGGAQDLDIYKKAIDQEPVFQLLAQLILEMKNTCSAQGASFFLYAHPEVVTVWDPYREAIGQTEVDYFSVENKLAEIAERDSFDFIGMVQKFLDEKERGPFHLLPNDAHCNGMGYRLQAEQISSYVLKEERNKTNIQTNEVPPTVKELIE